MAKRAIQKSARVAVKQSEIHLVPAPKLLPTHEQIAQRAFELFRNRDANAGSPIGDWLRAEAELAAAPALA